MVSVLTCYADGDPSVLLDEKFRNTYVPAGREDTHASGWAVSGDGGYITGRNSYDGFRMVDTDTDGNITMLKTLSSQSDGILTFESVLVFDDLTGNFEISLGNVNSDSLLLSFRQGKLYYKDAENDRFISDYIPSSRFGLRAEIDLTEGNTIIYVNGQLLGSNLSLSENGSIDRIKLSTGTAQVGIVRISNLVLYKGFILRETFIPYNGNEIGFDEYSSLNISLSRNYSEDAYGISLIAKDESAYFEKTVDVKEDAVLEFRFIADELLNTCLLSLKGNNDTIAEMSLNENGEICLSDVKIADYVKNVWYIVKFEINITDNTYDVSINYKEKSVDNSFINENDNISAVRFENFSSSLLCLDDINIYNNYDLPLDYVPVPQPTFSDEHYISILACNLWREGNNRGWDEIGSFPERSSLMGFYDEGTTEVADWETKWLVEHGVNCEIFCWYTPSDPEKPAKNLGFGIEAYMNSQYSNMMDFAIMWTNSSDKYTKTAFENAIVPLWLEHFFNDERYFSIDGKPVLYMFSSGEYLDTATKYKLTDAIAYLETKCIEAGYSGVEVYVYPNGRESEREYLLESGADGFFNYGYSYTNIESVKTKYQKTEYDNHIPVLAVNPNNQAWNGIPERYTEPEQFRLLAEWFRDIDIPNSTLVDGTGKKMLILDNWNEYGEGHYMMPTQKLGFSYLDVVREVFVDKSVHTDVIPNVAQKDRISLLYTQDVEYEQTLLLPEKSSDVNIVKEWNFDDPNDIPDICSSHISNLRIEDGKLKGTVNNNDPYFWWNDVDLDIDNADTVVISMSSPGEGGQIYFKANDASWAAVNFSTECISDSPNEYAVDMRYNSNWHGELSVFRIDVPTTIGSEFQVDYIKILDSSKIISQKNMMTNGGFEKETAEVINIGAESDVCHDAFYMGTSSLKVTKTLDVELIKVKVPNFVGMQKFYFSSQVKLSSKMVDTGNIEAYFVYNFNGEQYQSEKLNSTIVDGKWVRMSGYFEVPYTANINDAYICFSTDLSNGDSYYVDDIYLEPLVIKVNDVEAISYKDVKIHPDVELNINTENAVAFNQDDGSELSISVSDSNEICLVMSTPIADNRIYNVKIDGLTEPSGAALPPIITSFSRDVNISAGNYAYYSAYGTNNQEQVYIENMSGNVTLTAEIHNLSSDGYGGIYVFAVYYNGELQDVYTNDLTIDANSTQTVTADVNISKCDEIDFMIWDGFVTMKPRFHKEKNMDYIANIIRTYECNSTDFISDMSLLIENVGYGGNNSCVHVTPTYEKPIGQYRTILSQEDIGNTFPVKNGQQMNYGFWIKTSDTDLNSLAIYTPYHYQSKEDGQQKINSPCLTNTINLKDTTDWQYVSGTVTTDLTAFENDPGSLPKKWSFNIVVWGAETGAETEIWIDKVHFAPADLN